MKFFRNFFKSKLGLGITLGFLALIAFAFASSDVANTTMFGGVAGGDRVAVVGDTRISTADFTRSANDAVQRLRQQDPTLSMSAFVAQGGLEQVLEQMVSRTAIAEYAGRIGLRAGTNLVNSEIQGISAFRGPDGRFNQAIYTQALAAQGLNDRLVRDDLAAGLLAQQLLRPATYGTVIPSSVAQRYAALFKERRRGTIAFLPSAAFAPAGDPTDAQLQAFYQTNRDRFIRPERRILRFATFGADAVSGQVEPTEAAIAAYYQANQAQFAASETRSFTQVIAATQDQANAIRQAAQGGQSLANAAQQVGLRTTNLNALSRAALTQQASEGVAQAYFAAPAGALTAPARSALGWHVAQVTNITRQPGRTLAQARGEIAATLRERNRTEALNALSEEVEERLAQGSSLPQVAQTLGVQVRTTPPVTAEGLVYGSLDQTIDAAVRPAVATAFQMEESEPQLTEIAPGEYLLFDVQRITESGVAPLAEIRGDVATAWRLAQGLAAASRAADRLAAQAQGERTLAQAAAAASVTQAQIENIDLTREQLAQTASQRVPPPLALLFSMASGTSKKLEAEQGLGYYVVDLQSVEAGALASSDPLVAQARSSLGPLLGDEYAQQLAAAARAAVGYERNDAAFTAVRRQLTGTE
ncbi:peptidylprolyl isomerase [Porphyrobacter sp. GA68]|uniref:peptidylprolyl isomerase n=1 Tax=Porphyrobacter sp. GA68 TaxID=2883480 RepID=UPI001D1975A0|nr:peptidylprolyl isomerase [Porphyrobacter sp. GA68]